MRSTLIVVPVFCALAASAAQAPVLPYAYQRSIETAAAEDGADLYRIRLPEDAFAILTRSDLGDLRVLDAADQAQPMALVEPASRGRPSIKSVDLTVFPMARIKQRPQREFTMDARPSEDGRSVQLELAPGETVEVEENTGTDYVLLDARDVPGYIHHLKILWPTDAPRFHGRVGLYTSEELEDWQPVGEAGSEPTMLANVHIGEHRVKVDEIPVDAKVGPYLRMDWPADASTTEPMRVTAYLEPTSDDQALNWLRVPGEADDDAYIYDTGGRYPVEKIRLDLHADTVAEVRALSADRRDPERWQEQTSGRVHALELDGERFLSAPLVMVEAETDPIWRIESPTALERDGRVPDAEFGWRGRDVLFLPRGEPPFRLVYGSATARSRLLRLDDLTDGEPLETLSVAGVRLGERQVLEGEAVLGLAEERQVRSWVLAGLALVLIVLGAFLFRRR